MGFDFFKRLFSKRKSDDGGDNSADGNESDVISAKPHDEREGFEDNEAPLYMRVSFATDTGKVRSNNEDNFYIDGKYRHTYGKSECDCYIELTEQTHVFGLFDGMGGESFGETASALAAVHLEKIAPTLKQVSESELPFYMNEYARTANNAICATLADRNSRGGSTFVAICVKNGEAYPFYLGDSRLYLCDENGLLQITEDQTLAVRKIKAGVYTEEESRGSPDHHKLTCFLGVDEAGRGLDCQPCMPIPVKRGLKLLLCSDGLSDMCSREEILAALQSGGENTARKLVNLALENGGRDNVTCIVMEFDGFF
jgi:protein phosphatase